MDEQRSAGASRTTMVEPTAGAPAPGPPPAILLRRTLRAWPVAAATLLLGAALALAYLRARTLAFRSDTTIFYREGIHAVDDGGGDPTTRNLAVHLREMLLAQANLRALIDELHLYQDVVESRGHVDAVELMRTKITFKPRSAETFQIAFEGPGRDQVQSVTRRLAEALVEETARERLAQVATARDFLRLERERAEGQADEAERTAASFLAEHPEFAREPVNGLTAGAPRELLPGPGEPAGPASRASGERGGDGNEAPGRARLFVPPAQVGRPASPVARSPVADPDAPARAAAAAELASARKDLDEARVRFTDRHPDVVLGAARVRRAEAGVAALAGAAHERTEAAAQDIYAPAAPREAPSERRVATARRAPAEAAPAPRDGALGEGGAAGRLVALETEWARIARDLTKARQHLEDLEARAYRADMRDSSEQSGFGSTIAVLDPAYRPMTPAGASSRAIFGLACAASLLAGVALAALRGLVLDDRLHDVTEVDGRAPILAVIPALSTRERRREPASTSVSVRGARATR